MYARIKLLSFIVVWRLNLKRTPDVYPPQRISRTWRELKGKKSEMYANCNAGCQKTVFEINPRTIPNYCRLNRPRGGAGRQNDC